MTEAIGHRLAARAWLCKEPNGQMFWITRLIGDQLPETAHSEASGITYRTLPELGEPSLPWISRGFVWECRCGIFVPVFMETDDDGNEVLPTHRRCERCRERVALAFEAPDMLAGAD